MQIARNREELRNAVSRYRQQQLKTGFVPTMGNLHAGHLSLVEAAINECDVVITSIFVNPMQFGENEDLNTYPRTPHEDIAALDDLHVDLLYLPEVSDVYPGGLESQTRVVVPGLSKMLCGISRPLFFTGVATVVNRLFNLVQPDVAYFGRKDYQQLLVIRKMVDDLAIPIEIRGIDTVREGDGLAMSSRNNYLNNEQRSQASKLYMVLRDTALQYTQQGERARLEKAARDRLASYGFRPDYLEIRRSADLAIPESGDRDLIIVAAAWLEETRLIDNMVFSINE